MKKFAILAVMALAAATASATEIGVRGIHTTDASGDTAGITVSQKVGIYALEGAFDRTTRGDVNANRYALTGAIDVTKVGPVTIAFKSGVAFIDPSDSGSNGVAGQIGATATYHLTRRVSVVGEYAYQRGQERVRSYNGNQVSVGVKYSF